MERENFLKQCEIFKHDGETAKDAWLHIAAIRVADLPEIDIQDLIRRSLCYFYDDGVNIGFYVIGALSPSINIQCPKVVSFISIDSVVAISWIPKTDVLRNVEDLADTYFPGFTIDKTVTFTKSEYKVFLYDKKFATNADITNVIGVHRNDNISWVIKCYKTVAERNAGTKSDTVGAVIDNRMEQLAVGTYYLRVFGGNSGTTHDNATLIIEN